MSAEEQFEALLAEARACRHCTDLPLGLRPVLRASLTSRLLIIGQAPGTKVHETGIPWNDRSGQRLRDWLQMTPQDFYDEARIAIIPTGLCYPGRDPKGGDLPPRPDCAPLWHPRLIPALPAIRLTLLVGSYAQAMHLGSRRKASMTETVKCWRDYGDLVPLPHPSWRTTGWEKANPWFIDQLLPDLRFRLASLMQP